MSNTLLYLITGAFNTVSIARAFRHNATEKVSFLKELAAFCVFYAVTSAVYLMFGIPMLNMALNVAGMILLNRLYEKKLKRNMMRQ